MAQQDEIIAKIRAEAKRQGLQDPDLAVAVAMKESSLNPEAVGDRGQSLGLFQLQRRAAIDAGVDPERRQDVDLNIRGGVTYLKQKLDQSGGNVEQALRRYNSGTPTFQGVGDPSYVDRALVIRQDLENPASFAKYGAVETTPLTSVATRAYRTVKSALTPASTAAASPTAAPKATTVPPPPGAPATPQAATPPEKLPPQLNITVEQAPRGGGGGGSADTAPPPLVTTARNPDVELQEAVQSRDPRTPIIESGLRIMGKTRADFGTQFDNPQFVQKFYDATLAYAESIDKTLNASRSRADYNNSLLNHIAETEKAAQPQPTAPAPTAPKTPASEAPGVLEKIGGVVMTSGQALLDAREWVLGKPIEMAQPGEIERGHLPMPPGVAGPPVPLDQDPDRFTFTPTDMGDPARALWRGTQLVARGAANAALAYMDLNTDFVNLFNRAFTGVTGIETTPLTPAGPTLREWIDDVVAQPAGLKEAAVESFAGFLLPFSQLQKAKVLGQTGQAVGFWARARHGAASGLIVDVAFTDPDSPFFADLLDRWYRGYFKGDWSEMKGVTERYLDGTIGEDELRKRYVKRALRGYEGLVAGPVAEAFFMGLRVLKYGKHVLRWLGFEGGKPVPPGTPPDLQRAHDDVVRSDLARRSATERDIIDDRINNPGVVQRLRGEIRGRLTDRTHAEGLRLLDELRISPNGADVRNDVSAWLSQHADAVGPDVVLLRDRIEAAQSGVWEGQVFEEATDLATATRVRLLRDGAPASADESMQITTDLLAIQGGSADRAALLERYGPETTEALYRALVPPPPAPTPVIQAGAEVVNPLTGERLAPETPRFPTPTAERLARPSGVGREISQDQMERGQVLVEELRANPDNALARKDAGAWLDETAQSGTPLARSIRTEIENLTQYKAQPPGAPEPGALLPRGPEVPGRVTVGEDVAARQAAEARAQHRAAATAERERVARAPAATLERDAVRLGEALDRYDAIAARVPEGPGPATLDAIDDATTTARGVGAQPPTPAREPAGAGIEAQDAFERSATLLEDVDKPAAESGITPAVKQVVQRVKDAFDDPTVQRVVLAALLRGTIGAAVTAGVYDPGYAEADTPEERAHKRAAGWVAIALAGLGAAVTGRQAYRYIKRGVRAIETTGRMAPDVAPAVTRTTDLPASRGPWASPTEVAEAINLHKALTPTEIRQAATMPLDELRFRRARAQELLDATTQAGSAEAVLLPLRQRASLYTGMEQRATAATPHRPHPESTAAPSGVRDQPTAVHETRLVRTANRPEIVHRLHTTRLQRKQRAVTFVKTGEEALDTMRVNVDFAHDPEEMQAALAAFEAAVPQTTAGREALIVTTTRDLDKIADTLGTSPRKLQQLLDASNTPHELSARLVGVVKATQDSLNKFFALSDLIKERGGMHSIGDDLKHEFMYQLNRTGQWVRGYEMTISDFGRGMNAIRQLRSGYLGKVINEGRLAGREFASDKSIDDIIREMDDLRAQGGSGAASQYVRKITGPTVGHALTGAYVEVLLGSLATPAKAFASSLESMIFRPMESLAGAMYSHLPGQRQNLSKTMIQKGLDVTTPTQLSPRAYEAILMWQTLVTDAIETMKVSAKSFWTGQTPHMAPGTKLARHEGPAITAEAFGERLTTNHPYAASAVDAVGVVTNFYGTRLLNTTSEASQFLAGRQESKRYAYRMAMHEAEKGAFATGSDAFTRFMREFMDDPPEEVVAAINRTKSQVDMMQNLFDPDENFLRLRQMIGHLQVGMDKVPMARVLEPLLRAGTNFLTGRLESTPLAILSRSFRDHFRGPDPVLRAAAQGKIIVGTGLMGMLAFLGVHGIARGPLTSDPDLRDQYIKAGYPPNSLTIPGTKITIGLNPRLPLGFLLTAGAALGNYAYSDHNETTSNPIESNAASAVLAAWYALARDALFNKLFGEMWSKTQLEWERDIAANARKNKSLGETALNSLDAILTSHLPSRYLTEMARIIEPYKLVYDTLWEEWQTRIPGFLRTSALQTETDVFGRKRLPGGGLSANRLNNAAHVLTGMGFSDAPEDPVDLALAEKGVAIRDPVPVFALPKSNISVPMSKSEQQRLREIIAKPAAAPHSFYEAVKRAVNHPSWKDLSAGPTGQAALEIQGIYRKYSTAARAELWEENTEWSHSIREKIIQQGMKERRITPEVALQGQEYNRQRAAVRLR